MCPLTCPSVSELLILNLKVTLGICFDFFLGTFTISNLLVKMTSLSLKKIWQHHSHKYGGKKICHG